MLGIALQNLHVLRHRRVTGAELFRKARAIPLLFLGQRLDFDFRSRVARRTRDSLAYWCRLSHHCFTLVRQRSSRLRRRLATEAPSRTSAALDSIGPGTYVRRRWLSDGQQDRGACRRSRSAVQALWQAKRSGAKAGSRCLSDGPSIENGDIVGTGSSSARLKSRARRSR